MDQSILNDLAEIKNLNLDKEALETAKKYQEYKDAIKPFWKTSSFLTTIISVISITITGLLGYRSLIQTQNNALAAQADSTKKILDAQSKALESQTESAKRDLDNQRLIIQNLIRDTLVIANQKAMASLSKAYSEAEKQGISNLRMKIENLGIESKSQQLQAQQYALIDSIKTNSLKLDAMNQNLLRSKKEIVTVAAEKRKIELIALLYNLKSDVMKLLYPLKSTFTGKLYSKSAITPEERNNIILNIEDTRNSLNHNPLLNELISTNKTIKRDCDDLKGKLSDFEHSNSNRLLHDTRVLLDELSPKLDALISKIDALDMESLHTPDQQNATTLAPAAESPL